MSSKLIKSKCQNHTSREAVAKCPICQHYYCRECVTEHNNQFICVGCLSTQQTGVNNSKNSFFTVFKLILFSIFTILTSWYFFQIIGSLLLKIPSSFS